MQQSLDGSVLTGTWRGGHYHMEFTRDGKAIAGLQLHPSALEQVKLLVLQALNKDSQGDECSRLRAENAILRAALEHYADGGNWGDGSYGDSQYIGDRVDGYTEAREALANAHGSAEGEK